MKVLILTVNQLDWLNEFDLLSSGIHKLMLTMRASLGSQYYHVYNYNGKYKHDYYVPN